MTRRTLRCPDPFRHLLRATVRATRRFHRADDAATMAEYALLLGVVVIVALAGAKVFGTSVNTKLGNEAARVATP